jgi:hypothetical protein
MTKRKCSFGVRGARNARRMRYRDSVLGGRDNSSSHSDVLDDTIRGGRGNATALSAPPSDHQDTRTVQRYDTRLRRGMSLPENTSFELNTLLGDNTLQENTLQNNNTSQNSSTLGTNYTSTNTHLIVNSTPDPYTTSHDPNDFDPILDLNEVIDWFQLENDNTAFECPDGIMPYPHEPDLDMAAGASNFPQTSDLPTFLDESRIPDHYLGKMDQECPHCRGLHFAKEKTTKGQYNTCCNGGRICLDDFPELPEEMNTFYDNVDFRTKSRSYNNSISLASMEYNDSGNRGGGPPAVSINGQIRHWGCPMQSLQDQKCFAQLYSVDPMEAAQLRGASRFCEGLDMDIVSKLDLIMREVNPFVRDGYQPMFQQIREYEENNKPLDNLKLILTPNASMTAREMSGTVVGRNSTTPVYSEVAVLLDTPDKPGEVVRNICVNACSDKPIFIDSRGPLRAPLCYPLLFPKGELGYDERNSRYNDTGKRITRRDNLKFRLHKRIGKDNRLLRAGRISHHYIVDEWSQVLLDRMNFIKLESSQKQMRADSYHNLREQLRKLARKRGVKLGRCVILPSTFIGSPRYMVEKYHDALVLPRKFGKPDLFITMTCNPNWREITESLEPGQLPHERPDLITRVFHLKMHELLKDVTKRELFGKCKAYNYVVEFQSRGLPHMHLLLYLENKIDTAEKIDKIISAELPNPHTNNRLFRIIAQNNIHECSASRCLDENGNCRKNFPRNITDATIIRTDGWPDYKRPEIEPIILPRKKSPIDNRFVVNYNPHLSLKYDAHINVEYCAGLPSIKYLYKYMHKGPEEYATAIITNREGRKELEHNEPEAFLKSRIVGTCEAVWGIFGFEMSGMSHIIERLPVHLDGHQMVFYEEGREDEALTASRSSRLMAWFELNRTDNEAKQYSYDDIPVHYVFRNNKWEKRRMKPHKPILTRLHFVPPSDIERFSLRLLLQNVRGATSYCDLRRGYATFREAALGNGYMLEDHQWRYCLEDASTFKSAKAMRHLFAVICAHCAPSNPFELWREFREHLIDDFEYRKVSDHEAEEWAILDIEQNLKQINPILTLTNLGFMIDTSLDIPISGYDDHELQMSDDFYTELFNTNYGKMNNQQKFAFDAIIAAVDDRIGEDDRIRCFYLDGPGGTGKTFTYNTIISAIKSRGSYAVSCAFTGIASCQLIGGMTIHTQFGIPVNYEDAQILRMSPTSMEAEHLRNAALIIFDEAPMIPITLIEIIDRLLRDICIGDARNLPFGGKVVVFGGDMRQCLPIVKSYNKQKILASSIRFSPYWDRMHKICLTLNMRADDSGSDFARWLLRVGRGDNLSTECMPRDCFVNDEAELISKVYGNTLGFGRIGSIHDRCILAARNTTVNRLNELILYKIDKPSQRFYSFDSLDTQDPDDPMDNYPVEYLNSVEPSGFPPHELHLKIGAMVMLIRNLNIKKGLCNGTRFIIRGLRNYCIQAERVTDGELVQIPRIQFVQQVPQFPVPFRRTQYPLKLAFSMTINKAQGQTFRQVGVCLDEPVFSHGQLYVAFSRAKSFESLYVYHPQVGPIANIVYPEIASHRMDDARTHTENA